MPIPGLNIGDRMFEPVRAADAGGSAASTRHSVLPPLPDENTDAGAMARLLLAEAAVPRGTDMREVRREMDMMRSVLENRMKRPSDFAADRHAMNLTDIITASRGSVQFLGFENYPIIGHAQRENILGIIKAASAEPIGDRARYIDFINTAVAAATAILRSILQRPACISG